MREGLLLEKALSRRLLKNENALKPGEKESDDDDE